MESWILHALQISYFFNSAINYPPYPKNRLCTALRRALYLSR